jgi:hypothetical protein
MTKSEKAGGREGGGTWKDGRDQPQPLLASRTSRAKDRRMEGKATSIKA